MCWVSHFVLNTDSICAILKHLRAPFTHILHSDLYKFTKKYLGSIITLRPTKQNQDKFYNETEQEETNKCKETI